MKTPYKDFQHDERKITDDDFFKALDLRRPGLEKVADAWRQKDMVSARREVVNYFRTRRKPRWFYDLRGLDRKEALEQLEKNMHWLSPTSRFETIDEIVYAAREMLKNRLVVTKDVCEFDFGPDLNWNAEELQEHNSLSGVFKRLHFLIWMAVAHLVENRKAYISKYVQLLDKYLREWPLIWENKSPGAYHVQNSPVQEAMSTGFRAMAWLGMLHTDMPYHKQVPSDLTFGMIRSLWFTAWQYRRFDTHRYVEANHHFLERGTIPFTLALMLPEFPELRPMLDRGRHVSEQHVINDYYEEGGYREHSMHYTALAALMHDVSPPAYLARLNRERFLSANSFKKVRRCFAAMASMVQPDGCFPDIGDGGGYPAKSVLETGSDLFGSKACDSVSKSINLVAGKAVKKELPELSVCWGNAGYICGRDSWGSSADYFIMSSNTEGYKGHHHHDMLSLIVSVRGQTIIGEPAAYPLYGLTNTRRFQGTPLRGYVTNMTSHNTVLAYGKPIRADKFFGFGWGWYPPPVKIVAFEPEPKSLYVSAAHEGYACCRHQRDVLFVHKKGWLILERMGGPVIEDLPHIQRWHFETDVAIKKIGTHAVLATKGESWGC